MTERIKDIAHGELIEEIQKQLNFNKNHDYKLEYENNSFNSSNEIFKYLMTNTFSEEFINELAKQEVYNKHLFRPNTYFHKWWARRCGTTFRAIFKQFAPDNCKDYYTAHGLKGKIVLDPMMGGGTTLHEAIRLGANVIGVDIDPIPVVQARATLQEADLEDLRFSFNKFFDSLYKNLKTFFQTECPTCQQTVDSQYILHGLKKFCDCSEVVQIDQFDLRHENNNIIRIIPDTWEIIDDRTEPKILIPRNTKLITKIEKICPICKKKYKEPLDIPYYARYIPVAVVAICPEHGLFFRTPSQLDLARVNQANRIRDSINFEKIEDFQVKNGPKSKDLLKRNINSYTDLFSSRQLIYIHQALQNLPNFEGIIRLNLGLLISTSLEFNSMLCGYKGWFKRRPGAIRHTFALHAYCFPYTALENNPISPQKSSGNLQLLFHDRVERARNWANLPVERKIQKNGKTKLVEITGEKDNGIEVFQQIDLNEGKQKFLLINGDSRNLPLENNSVDLIITDPPYYDSVQYSNLAAFFRVWLSKLLPEELQWSYNEEYSAVATKNYDASPKFMTFLSKIFSECARVLKYPTGKMAFTFHHWQPEAWAGLTIALKKSNFRLIDSYVVFSEHPLSVHINNLNSIKHDSILVFVNDNKIPFSWLPVNKIDTQDSEIFCRHCNRALGWFLDNNFSEDEIYIQWKKLITGAK